MDNSVSAPNSSNFPVLGQLHSKLLRGLWRNPAFSQPSCSQPPDTTSQISDGFLCRIVPIGRILPVILGSILWSDDQSSSSSMDIMDCHVQVSCHSEVVLIPIVLGSKIYNHQPSFINDIPICWLVQYQQTIIYHLYYPLILSPIVWWLKPPKKLNNYSMTTRL